MIVLMFYIFPDTFTKAKGLKKGGEKENRSAVRKEIWEASSIFEILSESYFALFFF